MSLWAQLLHPHIKYRFDYTKSGDVWMAEAVKRSKDEDCYIIIPEVKQGSITIAKAVAFCDQHNCGYCY